jgi:hypothetical protein
MLYLRAFLAGAISALIVWAIFVMWFFWRSSPSSLVIESRKDWRYPPLFWVVELLVFGGVFYLIARR